MYMLRGKRPKGHMYHIGYVRTTAQEAIDRAYSRLEADKGLEMITVYDSSDHGKVVKRVIRDQTS